MKYNKEVFPGRAELDSIAEARLELNKIQNAPVKVPGFFERIAISCREDYYGKDLEAAAAAGNWEEVVRINNKIYGLEGEV